MNASSSEVVSLFTQVLACTGEAERNVHLLLGDPAAAREYYVKELAISERLAAADPSNSEAQRDLTVSYEKLGDVHLQLSDTAAARKYYEQYNEICVRQAADVDPIVSCNDISHSRTPG